MINLDYKSGKSIHEQIMDGIKGLIMNSALKEDDQLPSVRELSISLTVNPNTVQKAYKELELSGFIYSVKGKGNFVAKVKKADEETLFNLLAELEKIARELAFLGVDRSRVDLIINKIFEKGNDDD